MKYDFSEHLKKVLQKLKKKDPESHKAIKNKIEEIVDSGNIEHYKPLQYGLKNRRRVHIRSSFVLLFEYNPATDTIWFLDYDHHDIIYAKYR